MKKIIILLLLCCTFFFTACDLDIFNEFLLLGEWEWESDDGTASEILYFQSENVCTISGESELLGTYEFDADYIVSGNTLTLIFSNEIEVEYDFSIEGSLLELETEDGTLYRYRRL